MKRLISSILFLAVFTFCVNTGFGAIFNPPLEVVMGRFCMINNRGSVRGLNQRMLGSREKARIQMQPNTDGTVNISCTFIKMEYSAWLEVANGFGIQAFWIDTTEVKKGTYISFYQQLGNGEILLETGELTEDQQKEINYDLEKVPEIARLHSSSPTIWKAKNVWELIFFLPPEGENALRKVLQIQENRTLDSLRSRFLNELILTQNQVEVKEATTQKTLNALLEEGRKWIGELNSDSFQTRRLADMKLRELGLVTIMLAGETDWSALPPEAERRLALIVQESNVNLNFEDALQLEIHGWLDSPRIWAAALKYGTMPQKKIAWEVLEKKFPDLFEKKLKTVGLDLDETSTDNQDKIQRIFEMVQEEQ